MTDGEGMRGVGRDGQKPGSEAMWWGVAGEVVRDSGGGMVEVEVAGGSLLLRRTNQAHM